MNLAALEICLDNIMANIAFYGQNPIEPLRVKSQRDFDQDSRRRMAQQLAMQGGSMAPVQSHTEGIARALQGGLSGLLAGKARRDKEDRDKALDLRQKVFSGGLNAVTTALTDPVVEKQRPDPEFVGPMPARSGMEAALAAIPAGNSDFDLLRSNLALNIFKERQAKEAAATAQQAAQENYKFEQKNKVFAPPVLKPGVHVPFPEDVQNQKESLAQIKVDANQKKLDAKEEARKNKPMPASAIKQQSALLEKIGLAQGINADMASISGLLKENKIELGLFDNWLSAGKNYVGMSDAESRNYATFNSTLEKMRNDSLRLNNGVQTEGDAQRAWNELFTNINDQDYVKQRLKEIIVINKRAENLQRYQVDVLRNEFGKPALESMPSVRGAPGNTSTDPLSEEDQEAVDWARANPNDPRSAQILKLHGG